MDERLLDLATGVRRRARLRLLHARARRAPRYVGGVVRLDGVELHYRDLLSLYVEYKDIFVAGIYDFATDTPKPRVIDAGSHVGLSVVRIKQRHPDARVICLEPEPESRAVLQRNIAANDLRDVEVIPQALTGDDSTRSFAPDGTDGGRVVDEGGAFRVQGSPLSRLLDEPVDFLKLNIEGFELPVLRESRERLGAVAQMVVEYHGWPGQAPQLGELLTLLEDAGFRYVVNHLDYETNPAVRPPFRIHADSPWFALIYAARA